MVIYNASDIFVQILGFGFSTPGGLFNQTGVQHSAEDMTSDVVAVG